MYIKSAIVTILAVASSVAAQGVATTFTSPVGPNIVYAAGSHQSFTWKTNCVAPSINVAANPKAVKVQLLDNTDPNAASYVADVTVIDCSTAGLDNVPWTVPTNLTNYSGSFALQLVLTPVVYSGSFKITAPGGSTTTTTSSTQPTQTTKPSSANAVVPAFAGAAAIVGAAAMLL